MLAIILFWTAAAAIIYTYAGYGVVVWLASHLRTRPVMRARLWPDVTIVVVAHNEGARIAARLHNLAQVAYPAHHLEIIVASDGSTDDTVEAARAADPAARVIAFPVRRGKPAVLNDVIPLARGEIVVLADARQRFDPRAILALVDDFADPAVGAVSGELVLQPSEDASVAAEGTAAYWSYEKLIRWSESRIDSTVGATGAIYAIRKQLFEPIAASTVLDDVLIPMTIVRRGYRVLFEPRARAYDWPAPRGYDEFARKVRTIAGNFQLFAREGWLLDPRRNRLWLQTISHKGMRLVLPAAYLTLLASNLLLLDHLFYVATLGLQGIFVASAIAGYGAPSLRRRVPLVIVPYAVCFLAWATIVAFLRVMRGGQPATWDQRGAAARERAAG